MQSICSTQHWLSGQACVFPLRSISSCHCWSQNTGIEEPTSLTLQGSSFLSFFEELELKKY